MDLDASARRIARAAIRRVRRRGGAASPPADGTGRLPAQTRDALPQHDIGRATYGVPKLPGWALADLRIGAFCSIAADVTIFLGGEHRSDWTTTFPFPDFWPAARSIGGFRRAKGDVVIGNDVWIGRSATILSGVTIGDGSIIGAGSLVTTDVPPYTIVAGNPAARIRARFDPATVERLLAVGWWNWEDARIERYLPLMLSDRIEDFLNAAEAEPVADVDR
jgi:acetyltransferase-like isoleucine patch superfamily enzyme